MESIAIIGAGITGCMLARALSQFHLIVTVFEKEWDIARGTTMANSAIIHSGYDPIPGTRKAALNVLGNAMYEDLCKELDVDFKRIGSLTVATSQEEMAVLEGLVDRARLNQVPIAILNRLQVLAMEPQLSDEVVGALWAPTAGLIYPSELAVALMENAMENGVILKLQHEVLHIHKADHKFLIKTNQGEYQTDWIINCAGIYADQIHGMIGQPAYRLHPRRGQYFVLDQRAAGLVSHIIFPSPSEKGKGVLVTPTLHGNILVGPSSEDIKERDATETTSEGLEYVREKVTKLVKKVPFHQVIHSFAGIRATSDRHDFIIEEAEDVPGWIDVAGIESPGLASAPAIAQEVVDLLEKRIKLETKENYKGNRKSNIKFSTLSIEEKQTIIHKDSRYGNMICRCEGITEGEIVACIHGPVGARTVKAVKNRVRPGMGRCQGGFCEPLVVEILARELKIDPTQVLYDGAGSYVLKENTTR